MSWFVASVANQSEAGRRLLGPLVRHDAVGLLPHWSFFAPNPGTSDNHLLYRTRGNEGWSGWHEVAFQGRRTAVSAVWNPAKRRTKTLLDMTKALERDLALLRGDSQRGICLTTSYVSLLNVTVDHARRYAGAQACQFVVVEVDARRRRSDVRVVLRSEVHPLGRVAATRP